MTTKDEVTETKRVCVTGAAGYIGSWLVKNLLQRGYAVNATLTDPHNREKSGHLLSLEGAKERLRLFKADLTQRGTFDAAVDGCHGVFHTAALLDFTKYPDHGFIDPALNGSLGVLKSCTKARCVRRVVYTSTVAAASPLNAHGQYAVPFLDESCSTPVDFITAAKPLIWKYCVSKTLTERALVQYGADNQIEVVVIAPALVAGPFLTPALPSTVRLTLAPIKIQRPAIKTQYDEYEALKSLEYVVGSIPIVHVDDVCNAHIFLMENPSVKGRYICSAHTFTLRELADFVRERYPQFSEPSIVETGSGNCGAGKVHVSSKKLEEVGFVYKYDAQQIVDDSIEWAQKIGVLH